MTYRICREPGCEFTARKDELFCYDHARNPIRKPVARYVDNESFIVGCAFGFLVGALFGVFLMATLWLAAI